MMVGALSFEGMLESTGGIMHLVAAAIALLTFLAVYRRFRKDPKKYYKFLAGVAIYTAVFAISGVLLFFEIESYALWALFSFLRAVAILLIMLAMVSA